MVSSHKTTTARLALALSGATSCLLLAACASDSRSQLNEIRSNPTPQEITLTQRQDDIDNELTMQFDTDLRSMNRDLGLLLLLQGPSRLSPYPIR